ncbi:hypothetical protein QQF64_014376 [Cirrhinus molitorella]|uniref:Protein Wnt n=2 Tax=Cirrhinus TaxID=59897 RepID=A0ABR3NRY1_9TELE
MASYPIWWSLAVGHQYTSLGTQPILCSSIPGLVPKQLRFCRNYVEIMPSVAEGVKIGIQECQHQFRGRRWNCTTINDNLAIFGPVLDKATRESAFVHAIASAGVAFAVTRACSEGSVTICGCDTRRKGPPGEGWKWGGCSEDVEFGSMVSREFADARENRPDARSAMNRHNNEAGRVSITDHMYLKCKCHGLSGSCEVKTCWWSQPDFRVIGDYMKDKYDSASEMVVEKHRESRGWVETLRPKYTFFKPPTETDLVYYESSPNFCEPNPETGSFGTRDRICNLTSHGIDGCDLLCCGRGHNTRTEKRKEKCHCIFHWCCYVSCQECTRVYDVHTCKHSSNAAATPDGGPERKCYGKGTAWKKDFCLTSDYDTTIHLWAKGVSPYSSSHSGVTSSSGIPYHRVPWIDPIYWPVHRGLNLRFFLMDLCR